MPMIFPLKGVRYDPSVVGRLERVVTPPYDVISPQAQDAFYRKSPYNLIRILLGKERPGDRPGRDRYSRARATFLDWLKEGALRVDHTPGCYPYRQRFRDGGRLFDRWGVMALIRLGEPTLFPHEETHDAPKEDRLKLLEAVQANLSPIFGLIEDASGQYRQLLARATQRPPIASVTFDGVQHDLWRVTSLAAIHHLSQWLEARPMLLADGHHRYEVAMAFQKRLRQRDARWTLRHPANFMLAFIAAFDAQDPGILPTHRVFRGLTGWTVDQLASRGGLVVERVDGPLGLQEALSRFAAAGRPAIGCFAGLRQWAVAALAHEEDAVCLDVELLHRWIVPRCLPENPSFSIAYTQDWEAAVRQVEQESGTVAWCVRPPRLAQIIQCVKAGRRLPQKSTYFVPKPLSGLVLYRAESPGVPPRVSQRQALVAAQPER